MEVVECTSVIKFIYLKDRLSKETFDEMKEVYDDHVPLYNVVKQWHCQFNCGKTLLESAPVPGRPHSAIDDDITHKVEAVILEDRRITIPQLSQKVMINVGSVEKIISDHLHMQKLSTWRISWMLTAFQKQERVNVPRKRGGRFR
ncbi:uncharacterized protein LOC106872575 [Octopus bimaculoides]|uniref:uncharacterized protein LOC106872575 n=1 Tax=Octopus bimaculoides TaxID=37653 RepID=UPI00071C4A0F|nr:uncharacterized protein LOC106872575 [Octopus bimaculoides]|eukprot:XP_014775094.1 PREDICTED: uncharacterized protein LOC106872575 [Octopus bimaculoides]